VLHCERENFVREIESMPEVKDRSNLPVLLLYNLDRSWLPHERQESLDEAALLAAGLREMGHTVTSVEINDPDLKTPLSKFHPDDYVVFNWCEGVPGIPWSDALVADSDIFSPDGPHQVRQFLLPSN
jgi:hypothetical protein